MIYPDYRLSPWRIAYWPPYLRPDMSCVKPYGHWIVITVYRNSSWKWIHCEAVN